LLALVAPDVGLTCIATAVPTVDVASEVPLISSSSALSAKSWLNSIVNELSARPATRVRAKANG